MNLMNTKSNYLAPDICSFRQFESVSVLAASYGDGTPGVFNEETDTDNYGEF